MISKGLFFSCLVAAAALGGLTGFLVTHYAGQSGDDGGGQNGVNSGQQNSPKVEDVLNEDNITQFILNEVDPELLREVLRNLTYKPHIAGSEESHVLAEYVRDLWIQYGIEDVKLKSFDVLLSRVERDDPNVVSIIDEVSGQTLISMVQIEPPLYAPEESDPDVTPSFNGYSATGKVTGDLVYANFGQVSDFQWIINQGIDLTGKIVLARYGGSFRGDISRNAEEYGAAGVILFSDPHEYAPAGRDNVYPDAFYLPGTGTQCGSLLIGNGDPTTFRYPSVEGAYRIPDDDLQLPKIPVQPIGYDDAEKLLNLMTGAVPPDDWIGDLNVSYRVGPGFTNTSLKVVLDVKTHNQMETIYDVIGIIPGAIEPDRYVVLGNHRDAWIFGAIDPNSGTTVLTELVRVFGQLLATGWKPRRTIIFCSWASEEYGLIGSTEWVEENAKLLGERAVAYLNVDSGVDGNFTLSVKAVPSLKDVVFESAKKVPNPNPEEVAQGRPTVYDTWLYVSSDLKPPPADAKPYVAVLGSGSDYTPFLYFTGVTALAYNYAGDYDIYPAGNPLYHSLYETFYTYDTLVDPGYKYATSIVQIWGETARALADTAVIPLSMTTYALNIEQAFYSFNDQFEAYLTQNGISLDYFLLAVQHFSDAAKSFNSSLSTKDLSNPLVLRAVNDQIMQVERAFIEPEGLPLTPMYKHVVLSPSSYDEYSGQYFSGLVDLINKIQSTSDPSSLWEVFKQHLAAVTYYIQSAAYVLEGEL